jgi:secondary thiamine-phosphate synthase enzyme
MSPVFSLRCPVPGPGLHEITDRVRDAVRESGIAEGLCTVAIRENADPSVCRDLEAWLARLVPEDDPLYTHTAEGPDDMPAHIRSALTASSVSIPVLGGEPALGTWQGIFLWEHRRHRGARTVLVHVGS